MNNIIMKNGNDFIVLPLLFSRVINALFDVYITQPKPKFPKGGFTVVGQNLKREVVVDREGKKHKIR